MYQALYGFFLLELYDSAIGVRDPIRVNVEMFSVLYDSLKRLGLKFVAKFFYNFQHGLQHHDGAISTSTIKLSTRPAQKKIKTIKNAVDLRAAF